MRPRIDPPPQLLNLAALQGGLAAGYLVGLYDDPPDSILVHVDHSIRRADRGPWRFRRELPDKRFSRPRGYPLRSSVA